MDQAGDLARGYAVLADLVAIGIVALFLACPICSAIVASAKGRDAIGWFFVGLLFGPFGLIAIVGMPTREQSEDIKAMRGQSSLKLLCPACREPVWREAEVCGHCGTDFAMWHGKDMAN